MPYGRTNDQSILRAIAAIKLIPDLRLGRGETGDRDGPGAILRVTLSGSCAEKRREERPPTDKSKSSRGPSLV